MDPSISDALWIENDLAGRINPCGYPFLDDKPSSSIEPNSSAGFLKIL
jgi:hypothetical protein